MQFITIASAAAILAGSASTAAVPVADIHARGLFPTIKPSNNATLDQPLCLWESETVYVAFLGLIPGVSSDAFKKALKGDSACNSYSQYQGVEVGAKTSTLATVFYASDFCTADRVTKIIKNAGGPDIACDSAEKELKTDVGPDALLVETLEDGDDGEDVTKRATKDSTKKTSGKGFLKLFTAAMKKAGL